MEDKDKRESLFTCLCFMTRRDDSTKAKCLKDLKKSIILVVKGNLKLEIEQEVVM